MSAVSDVQPPAVLYQDQQLVVVHKPAWWVIHKTRGARGAPILLDVMARALGQPVWPVHRLDRQTSGVLVLALSAEVAAELSRQIREGLWRKAYLGLCRGVVSEELRVDHPVLQEGVPRPAATDFIPLEHFCDRYTLLQCVPHTGRRHQIRRHLKHQSHPIIGDTNHGQGPQNRFFRETFDLRRMFLHAETLRLLHPVENRLVQLTAPLPDELEQVLDRLRGYRGPVI